MCEQLPVRIALVEDDSWIARAIVRILHLMGIRADHFHSAEDLLSFGDVKPHCYVVDLNLPGMSGFDLHCRLRAMQAFRPVAR